MRTCIDTQSSYALIATSTDYDAWREEETTVTAAEVFKVLHTNAALARTIAANILEELHEAAEDGHILTEEAGCMKFAIMPRSEAQKPEDLEKLAYVLPGYFS